MATMSDIERSERRSSLEKDKLDLERRLNEGWIKCNQARGTPNEQRFDDHWISLLRTYESVASRLAKG
jgi:hypothetical protein